MNSFLEKTVGQRIVAIEPANDYVQIHLADTTILTVFNPIRSGPPLNQFVGCKIERVACRPDEVFFFLAGGGGFAVSLAEEDYRGPEAMSYIGPGGDRAVWS
jgi:hypothetical protein